MDSDTLTYIGGVLVSVFAVYKIYPLIKEEYEFKKKSWVHIIFQWCALGLFVVLGLGALYLLVEDFRRGPEVLESEAVNFEIKSSIVDTLRSEFYFDETLKVIEKCSNKSSCKTNLESIGLKQILSGIEGEMYTEGYFKSPDDQIIGYTIRFLDSDGTITFVDALVNPLVEGNLDKIENLIRDSYDEIDATTDNDASLYWLGRYPLGDKKPRLKIMIFKEKKEQNPETSLRYLVSY